MGVERFV